MSTSGDGPPEAEVIKPKPARRPQTNVLTMVALVACCGVVLWAWKVVWDSRDPTLLEARAIQDRAIAALRSPKAADRMTAIQALDRLVFGDIDVAIGPLAAVLRDEDSEVRLAAAEALGRLGSEAIHAGSNGEAVRVAATALIGSLKDSQPEIRIAAARALGTIASTSPAAGRGSPPRGRNQASRASAVAAAMTTPIDRRAVIDGLVVTLSDRDNRVCDAARTALASVGGSAPIDPPRELAAGLKDEASETRGATAAALANFSHGLDPWIPALLRLAEHDPDPAVRATCAKELGRVKRSAITEAGVSALAAGLGSRWPQVRIQVAALLGRLGPDAIAASPALIRVLDEPLDPEVARQHAPPRDAEAARRPGLWMLDDDPACVAADALGRIAPGSRATKEVVAALIEVTRAGPRLRRGWAAFALGKFGPAAAEAIPGLINVIEETGPSVGDRYNADAAVWALGQIAPDAPSADQAVTALVGVLQSKSWESRATALKALRQFGPKAAQALPEIRALQSDPDREVKDAATETVRVIEKASGP
jgi:HEAT repeat protein